MPKYKPGDRVECRVELDGMLCYSSGVVEAIEPHPPPSEELLRSIEYEELRERFAKNYPTGKLSYRVRWDRGWYVSPEHRATVPHWDGVDHVTLDRADDDLRPA